MSRFRPPAAPDRPAIAYVGDGAWGMSFGELQTCVRENSPVIAVVFNNGQWGAEKKNHVDFYSQRFNAVNLDSPSWAAVAKAFGCEGVTVDRLSAVGPALQAAVEAGGCVVSVPVSGEGRLELLWYVQEQSISIDYHRYGNLGQRAAEERAYRAAEAEYPDGGTAVIYTGAWNALKINRDHALKLGCLIESRRK
jgi:hypothetical protein